MAGINISFVSDVRSFLKGTRDIEGAMDDVADSLDDVARDSQRMERDVSRDLDGIAREAGQMEQKVTRDLDSVADEGRDAGQKLERSFREAFDVGKRESRDAGQDIERNTRRSFDDAGDRVGEFKDEARQNFSEVASSFTGDMDSAVDLVQGTFGGLAGSIAGPVGLALGGLGASAGVFYTLWKENAERVERRVQDMYEDMRESGNAFLSEEFIAQGVADIFGKTEDAVIKWENLQKIVEATGATEALVARAYAGDAQARVQLLETVAAKEEEVGQRAVDASAGQVQGLIDEQREIQRIREGVEELGQVQGDAAARAEGYREAVSNVGLTAEQAAENARRKWVDLDTYLDQTTGRKRTVSVDVDLSDAERRIDDFLNRRRNVTVGTRLVQQPV